MPYVSIIINQVGKIPGIAGVSRDDLDVGSLITLTNDYPGYVDVTSIKWEFVSWPKLTPTHEAPILNGTTSESCTFMPEVIGTYIIELTLNNTIKGRIGAAIKTTKLKKRLPGELEADEYIGGWGYNLIDFLRALELNSGGGGGSTTLCSMSDVDCSGALDGYVLKYNDHTGFWEPGSSPTTLCSLNDVDCSGAEGGDLLTYDEESGLWIPVEQPPISDNVDTEKPWLSYVNSYSISISAAPGRNSEIKLTLQDGVQRNFTGTLTSSLAFVGEGGLDTGVEAPSTPYYCFLVPSVADDNILTTRFSANSASIGPVGYSNFSYIGAVCNDSLGDIYPFRQVGRKFSLLTPSVPLDFTGPGAADTFAQTLDLTGFVPVGAKRVELGVYFQDASSSAHASTHTTGSDQIPTVASGFRGLVPAAPNPSDSTKFLSGNSTWLVPAGSPAVKMLGVVPTSSRTTTSASFVNIDTEVSGSFTIDVAGTYLVELTIEFYTASAWAGAMFQLVFDASGTPITIGTNDYEWGTVGYTSNRTTKVCRASVVLSAASHTVNVQWRRSANTGTLCVDTYSGITIYGVRVA